MYGYYDLIKITRQHSTQISHQVPPSKLHKLRPPPKPHKRFSCPTIQESVPQNSIMVSYTTNNMQLQYCLILTYGFISVHIAFTFNAISLSFAAHIGSRLHHPTGPSLENTQKALNKNCSNNASQMFLRALFQESQESIHRSVPTIPHNRSFKPSLQKLN